jgi:hypothetical protein
MAYLGLLGGIFGDVRLEVFNVLLVAAVVPIVWLIAVGCIWSANQHAAQTAKEIERIEADKRRWAREKEHVARVRREVRDSYRSAS